MESTDIGDPPLLAQADTSGTIGTDYENQGAPSTSETNLTRVLSDVDRPVDEEGIVCF